MRIKPALNNFLALAFVFALLGNQSAFAQWRPATQVGLTQAPTLQLQNLSGKTVNITDFKGKVIVVNFWASWCEPCREEFEELTQLQENYRSKGLIVLAVNLAEMKPRIIQFLRGNGLPENGIEILLDRNSITYKTWHARGIPTTFLVGKTGKIEGVWIGAIDNVDSDEVKGKVEALLRQ
ncbi:TlpA family protein disulfide reductase [Polynucleobacter necessarius]|uniref:TlpA family protein disulfide reductase n=1 Tax=Polynucleobacter necessarius TaxID=576610 RepID=UPI000E09316D|nr:TlpA disulfide reductase family protein [Polynucleobacter necessarius]